MSKARKSYPSDVSDAEWEFLAPFLALMREDAPQQEYPLRTLFNAMRYVVKTGCPWRFLPNDLPPWAAVYQQARRWFDAGVFEQVSHELRVIVRIMDGRASQPTAAILDARTVQSTPESGGRGGYDGAKKKKGSKVHVAVDTLGNLLALLSTPANASDMEQVKELAKQELEVAGKKVEVAFTDQGFTGNEQAAAAEVTGFAAVDAVGFQPFIDFGPLVAIMQIRMHRRDHDGLHSERSMAKSKTSRHASFIHRLDL